MIKKLAADRTDPKNFDAAFDALATVCENHRERLAWKIYNPDDKRERFLPHSRSKYLRRSLDQIPNQCSAGATACPYKKKPAKGTRAR